MFNSQNLWRTYWFILLLAVSISFLSLLISWQSIKNQAQQDLRSTNLLVKKSVASFFKRNDVMLSMLANQCIAINGKVEPKSIKDLANHIVEQDKELLMLGLAAPNGDIKLDYQQKKIIWNVHSNPNTSTMFIQVQNTGQLKVGSTFLFPMVDKWVIPIFIPFTAKDTSKQRILVAFLKHNEAKKNWAAKNLPETVQLLVLKANYQTQFISHINHTSYSEWYSEQPDEDYIAYLELNLLQQTGNTLEQLKFDNDIVALEIRDIKGNNSLMLISFDPEYQHFVLTNTSVANLYHQMLAPVLTALFMMSLFSFTLYLIFKHHSKMLIHTQQQLKYQAWYDPLTDFPNRRYLLEHFQQWQRNAGANFFMLYIDLNNFKVCNDIHGHSVGDKLLQQVATRIKQNFEHSLAIRQGGDEFIILVNNIEQSALFIQCEQFLQQLSQPMHIAQLEFIITASIGIARAPVDGEHLDELLRKADMAMYEAKKHRTHIYQYSQWLEQQTKQQSEIEQQLKSALAQHELSLVYQPQVCANTGKTIGMEALVRWQNPVLGQVSPAQFIPIAESTGLIHAIGDWVLSTAIQDILELTHQASMLNNKQKFRLSVNISVHQLMSKRFLYQLKKIIKQHPLDKLKLMLEITESLMIDNIDKAQAHLTAIQQLGIQISLDDFGTGFSSLNVLTKLPIHEIKIDKSFVHNMLDNAKDTQLIKSIIRIGQSLEIPIIAEGVETQAQADFLIQQKCDFFQGYLFAKPMTKAKLSTFLTKHE